VFTWIFPGSISCCPAELRARLAPGWGNPNNCSFTGPDRARPGARPPVCCLNKKIYLRG
jgi:hypothetical protein